ncbi:MAG: PAS domain S-box protein [Trichocoleus desertorum ATA4-8-CV12]|nr:PAS domain S-box protein [Trichocoleus desertorum ATA4-8-CV12]
MLDFQRLFESIPELYLVLTLDFVVVGGSDARFQATKVKREEVIGRHLFDIFLENPHDPYANAAQNLRASLESVLKNCQPHTMERLQYGIYRPEFEGGGFEERYWKVVNSPIFDEVGELTHILNRAEDVTEFVQMQQQRGHFQQEVAAAKRQVEAVLASIQDGFYACDRDWRFTYVNNRLCEMVGMAREALLGQRIWDLFADLHDTDLYWQFHQAMSEQMSSQSEYFYPPWDRWYEHRVHPTPEGLTGLATDITVRKRVEERLRESEEKFRTFANTIPVLMWQQDTEGKNVWVNQYFIDFAGKTAEEVSGKGWEKLLHPNDAEKFVANFMEAVRLRQPWHGRVRARRHDGRWRWLESFIQPLFGSDGMYLGHVGVTPDVTATVEAEEALRENMDELTRFNRVVVGRELRMIELKKEVNELLVRQGSERRYPLEFELPEEGNSK